MTELHIAGAGLYGLTIAERAANAGVNVTIYDVRNHIGGNAWSYIDAESNIEVHAYGSHIFHTNNEKVWEYCNRFTSFVPYRHRVRTLLRDNRVIPLPFNLASFSALHGFYYSPSGLRTLVDSFPDLGDSNLESVAISSVGRSMYEAVIKGYTKKQWGRDPKDLPGDTIKRLPIRYNWDDSYFSDKYQGLPEHGYHYWLMRMADHPRITIHLNSAAPRYIRPLVWTGPIDQFFDYEHGELGWRKSEFILRRYEHDYQGCPVINHADAARPYTRVHEYKHYRPDRESNGTIVHFEMSQEAKRGEIGFYPVNTNQDRDRLIEYRNDARKLQNVWFGGRLGSYQYLDMHMAIAAALTKWETQISTALGVNNA